MPRMLSRRLARPLNQDAEDLTTDLPTNDVPAPRHSAIRRSLPRLAFRAGVGLAAVLMVAVVGLLLLRTAHEGRMYPAIVIADLPVGGLTYGDASQQLAQRAASIEQQPVTFQYGDRTWESTLAEAGITVDTDSALARAYDIGREETAWQRLRATASLIRNDTHVPLPLMIDHAQLGRWFDQIDADLAMTPRNAALEITNGEVIIVPEVDGTVVDRNLATSSIIESLRFLEPVSVQLPTTYEAPILRAADLEPARASLANALSAPVQISFESGIWTI